MQYPGKKFYLRDIQLGQREPFTLVQRCYLRPILFKERRFRIIDLNGADMPGAPIYRRVKLHFTDHLAMIMQDRDRDPLPSLGSPDAVTVLPFVFFKLHII